MGDKSVAACKAIFGVDGLAEARDIKSLAALAGDKGSVDDCDLQALSEKVGIKIDPKEFRRKFAPKGKPDIAGIRKFFADSKIRPPALFEIHYDFTGVEHLEKDEDTIRKKLEAVIPTAIAMIAESFPEKLTSPFSFRRGGLEIEGGAIMVFAADIETVARNILGSDIEKRGADIEKILWMDGATIAFSDRIDSESAKIMIVVDFGLIFHKEGMAPLVAALAHEIVGHIPTHLDLDAKTLNDPHANECVAFERSVPHLEAVAASLEKKGGPKKTVENLKKAVEREKLLKDLACKKPAE